MNKQVNYMWTSKGKNDDWATPAYAVEPLLEFLEPFRGKVIWCPFDTEESEFVRVLTGNGFKVINTDIKESPVFDFYTYEPQFWDLMVSNPPFSNKKGIFERALSFNKPFALLNSLHWLNDGTPSKVFKNKQLQLLMFNRRVKFSNNPSNKINFGSAYYCYNFLPRDIVFRELEGGK